MGANSPVGVSAWYADVRAATIGSVGHSAACMSSLVLLVPIHGLQVA